MSKYYSKDKCKCIKGKEIVGMGRSTDEHLECHECGWPLFPWERGSKVCGGCTRVRHMREAGVFDD